MLAGWVSRQRAPPPAEFAHLRKKLKLFLSPGKTQTSRACPVLQMLAGTGVCRQRAPPPAEIARRRQAQELGLPDSGVNLHRMPAPAEVHRGVQDEALAERMALYQVITV